MQCEFQNREGIVNGIMCGESGAHCYSDPDLWCIDPNNEKQSYWTSNNVQTNSPCDAIGKLNFNEHVT